jgi:hypothetical protein
MRPDSSMKIFPRTNFESSGRAREGVSMGSLVFGEETGPSGSIDMGVEGSSKEEAQALKVNASSKNSILDLILTPIAFYPLTRSIYKRFRSKMKR